MCRMQRRRLLRLAAGGTVGISLSGNGRTRAGVDDESSRGDPPDPSEFDPGVHGFGFANWSGDVGTDADGEEFTYEPSEVSRDDVRSAIDESWTTTLSGAQMALMTRIVYSWIGGETATNGHCYGMAFAAEGYFREPGDLPDGVDAAAEIPRPTDPYDAVGDRIRWLQTSQLLRAELFWYAVLGFRWGLADPRESLGRVTRRIDAVGTAGLALDGEAGTHQVLAYDYERSDDVTDVDIYDPNYGAADYEDDELVWTLSVDPESGEVLEIKEGYDDFLYHHPEMGFAAVDRLLDGRDRLLETLSNAVFLGLESTGTFEIYAPEDAFVDRPVAEYADPDRAPYADAAVVVGPIEAFEITIDGGGTPEYSLEAFGLREDEPVIEQRVSGTFDAASVRLQFTIDEAGEFVVDAVETTANEAIEQANETAEGTGEAAEETTEAAEEAEERAVENPEGTNEGAEQFEARWLLAAAGGALGLGAAYRYLARRGDDENERM